MRPHGKYAEVNQGSPEAFAVCDRCGFWRNRSDLVWQLQWGGTQLFSQQILVCADRCYDTPNEQLRTIILPPDPPPVENARVPDFAYEEQTVMIAQFGAGALPLPPWGGGPQLLLCDQTGEIPLLLQYTTSS